MNESWVDAAVHSEDPAESRTCAGTKPRGALKRSGARSSNMGCDRPNII